ncbi:MAG: TRAP transporter TatT component family protein [Anaeromyxobacteraceae bacterium]
MRPVPIVHLTLAVLALAATACSGPATSIVASAVSESSEAYAREDDVELVRLAVPFGLKTMEGLLEKQPRHKKLLTALTANFTQYTYGFVQEVADEEDWAGRYDVARTQRERAKKLLLRARDYGLRGLDEAQDDLGKHLREGKDVKKALAEAEKDDVPLLYWTATAWLLAISDGKSDMALVAELPVPLAMMERALALDETWGDGSLHEFYVTWDGTRSVAEGGGPQRAKQHLDRALALSMNKKLGPLVSWAEGALVMMQDRPEFERVLKQVLEADPGAEPRFRLANVFAQRRAKALLARADDLFL